MPVQAVSLSPEEASYRLSVAEGLLSSLGSGPLVLVAAARFLGADELTVEQARSRLLEETKKMRRLPLRATSGKKGAFHGMHGREKAVRSRMLLPGAGVAYCPSCNSVKPSATAACPNCGAPADPSASTDTGGAALVSVAQKVTEAVQTLVKEGPPAGSQLCAHCGAALSGEKAAGGKIDCPACGMPNNAMGGGWRVGGLAEATVVGNPSVPGSPSSQTATPWGGVPPFAAADPDGDGDIDVPDPWRDVTPRPPNLRRSREWTKCGNCIFFFKGCNLYGLGRDGETPDMVHDGQWPVDDGDVCDSHQSVLGPVARQVAEATYQAAKGRSGKPVAAFDASKHKRQPKGRRGGGEFAPGMGPPKEQPTHREVYGRTNVGATGFQTDQRHSLAHVANHGLEWGDRTFHDVASFKAWLGKHGVSWAHFMSVHRGAADGLAVHERRKSLRHSVEERMDKRSLSNAAPLQEESMGVEQQLAAVRAEIAEATGGMTISRLRAREAVLARRVREAADSMMKATVHEPVGKPGGPGLWKHKGMQLPAYIQHIANDIREGGKTTSHAIAIAVATVKRWCAGGGKVHPDTRAAACKAVAEWEKLKAEAHARSAGKKLSAAYDEIEAIRVDRALVEAVVPPPVEGTGVLVESKGTPDYIATVARHLHLAKGKTLGEAVAIAVNVTRRRCHEAMGAGEESPACGAIAEWDALRSQANLERVLPGRLARQLTEAEFGLVADDFELAYAAARDAYRPLPPSLNYTRKLLADVGLS